jgi:hypothetical protein
VSDPILEERRNRQQDRDGALINLWQGYQELLMRETEMTAGSLERKAARDQFCDGVKGLFQAKGGVK